MNLGYSDDLCDVDTALGLKKKTTVIPPIYDLSPVLTLKKVTHKSRVSHSK